MNAPTLKRCMVMFMGMPQRPIGDADPAPHHPRACAARVAGIRR